MPDFCLVLVHVPIPPHTFTVCLFIVGVLLIIACLEIVTGGGREMNSAVPRVQSSSDGMRRGTSHYPDRAAVQKSDDLSE